MARWSKPNLDTRFHISYEWWEQSGLSFRLYLFNQLCPECRDRFVSHHQTETVDWINPNTGEVSEADALLQCLRLQCANQPGFVSEQIPLASAVFRIFLANDNTPLSARELHKQITWRQPEVILRTLGSRQVNLGIRPVEL